MELTPQVVGFLILFAVIVYFCFRETAKILRDGEDIEKKEENESE